MIPVTSFKDFYKVDHRRQYPDGTITVYSNFTPRKSRVADVSQVVFFGLQGFIKEFLIRKYDMTFFNRSEDIAVAQYKRRLDTSLGKDSVPVDHIRRLHKLRYLPIVIKALPEGSLVNTGVPVLTIKNTLNDFYWLTNDLETILSCELWKPITSATTANLYYKICTEWAIKTGSPLEAIPFQCHDFSFRGMSGVHDAMTSGAAHLTSGFVGSDTIPAIDYLEEFYNADAEKELIATSIPATEHSVMCMGTKEDEFETYRRLIFDVYPQGYVGLVSDTWSLENVVLNHIKKLSYDIRVRGAQDNGRVNKVVLRPDSGYPPHIIAGYRIATLQSGDNGKVLFERHNYEVVKYEGKYYMVKGFALNDDDTVSADSKEISRFYAIGLIESLMEIFGGTKTSTGHWMLDPCIGAIYGDSITPERAIEIFQRLHEKNFASGNIVLGIGSYTYQYVTRDTYGMAMKATYGEVAMIANEDMSSQGGPSIGQKFIDKREIWKDPETDDGTKKSAKGLIRIEETFCEDIPTKPKGYVLFDQVDEEAEQGGALKEVFRDGKLLFEISLADVRKRVASYR